MPPDEVLNEQAVLQQAKDEDVLLHDAGAVEAALLVHGQAEHAESLDEVVGAEVLESGLRARALAMSSAGSRASCDPASSMKSRMARTSSL